MFDPSFSVASLPATYGSQTVYLPSVQPAPQWFTTVQPGAYDGVAAYAASQPTGYDATPVAKKHARLGSSLLDALQELIAPMPSNNVGVVTSDGVPTVATPVLQALAVPVVGGPATPVLQALAVPVVGGPVAPVAPAPVPTVPVAVVVQPAMQDLPMAAPVAAAPAPQPSPQSVASTYAGGAVDVSGVVLSKARVHGVELWAGLANPRSVHVTQVPSKYNTHPTPGNRDCGPASVVMTLRMLKITIPGVATKADGQKAITAVRKLTGVLDPSVATTNFDLEGALGKAGAKTAEVVDMAAVKAAVLAGSPVILNGNPRNPGAYGWKYSAKQMMPYNGAHWIVVTGIDKKTNRFIINDPLSSVGPVEVTAAQLDAYRGGSMGIAVSR